MFANQYYLSYVFAVGKYKRPFRMQVWWTPFGGNRVVYIYVTLKYHVLFARVERSSPSAPFVGFERSDEIALRPVEHISYEEIKMISL